VSAEQIPHVVPWYRSPVFEEFLGSFLGELALPYAPEAAGMARAFTRCVAATWGVPHVAEDAELCVSEAVTNAYQHTDSHGGKPLRLVILRADVCLRCEVHDPSRVVPHMRAADMLDESGRGMYLVGMVARRNGVYPTDGGKAVWFELDAWTDGEGGR
jgi:anti-sigma regulatory factor (Ser/Thr protein kinase)